MINAKPSEVNPHRLLTFDGGISSSALVRALAVQLANYYSKSALSRKKWKDQPRKRCRWELKDKDGSKEGRIVSKGEQLSEPFHPDMFARDLTSNHVFDSKKYNLPEPMCRWLDINISMGADFHSTSSDKTHALTFRAITNLGPKFPMAPTLDREGMFYISFQGLLVNRILNLRQWLVENSHITQTEEWFQNFRSVVSEAVSLTDNTLHQIYFKAQHDPLPGWKFQPEILGERHGRRLMDKLKWVYQITGNELNARDEIAALGIIKDLRNHLQHFDPPCFACSLEEVAEWLNALHLVIQLNLHIRQCASALPSIKLIELLLQPMVKFAPKDSTQSRVPRPSYCGYASTSAAMLAAGTLPTIPHTSITLQYSREENLL